MRAQHLWQTVNPYRCSEAVADVDDMSAFAIAGIFGKTVDVIPDLIWRQIYLPQRFGGCGYRKSKDVFVLSFLGGFAMAAYSPIYMSECRSLSRLTAVHLARGLAPPALS